MLQLFISLVFQSREMEASRALETLLSGIFLHRFWVTRTQPNPRLVSGRRYIFWLWIGLTFVVSGSNRFRVGF